jgi:hypothetical protein
MSSWVQIGDSGELHKLWGGESGDFWGLQALRNAFAGRGRRPAIYRTHGNRLENHRQPGLRDPVLFFPAAWLAIVFGHLSLAEIRKSAGRLTGHKIAMAGLILELHQCGAPGHPAGCVSPALDRGQYGGFTPNPRKLHHDPRLLRPAIREDSACRIEISRGCDTCTSV